jgi:hypothetical protein
VTDNLTGLMWVRTPDSTTRSWGEAVFHANNLSLCSYNDWRLPNVNELESLVNAGEPKTALWLNTQGFSNVQPGDYWSSTNNADDESEAWRVEMWAGNSNYNHKGDNYHDYVWPVRGGETGGTVSLPQTGQKTSSIPGDDGDLKKGVAWPSPRFHDNGNGTVTDNLTGLIWLRDADCLGSQHWDEALAVSNALASGQCGLSDGSTAGEWRLPNKKELLTLIDRSSYGPALQVGHPFINVQPFAYWSSTTDSVFSVFTTNALVVYIWQGYVFGRGKNYDYGYVLPVRGGGSGTLNHKPTLGTLTPSAITTKAGTAQTFTAVYIDVDGFADLKTVDFLVSPTGTGANSIWARYNAAMNKIYLYNNAGTALLAAKCTPGVAGSLQNNQGMINCGGSTVTKAGNRLTVKWRIIPKGSFAAAPRAKQLKVKALDKSGATSGWKVKGTWTINP